jgi:diaminopimelate decarboxylase
MDFAYLNGALCAERVPLEDIARRFGTPCFVYSRATIERQFRAYQRALEGRESLVAYSVKANSNLAVLALMARLGAGFDIVSGGELARVLAAGGDPRLVLFSGIGKSEAEIARAIEAGILCLNVESEAELERVDAVAQRIGARAPIALRVNPDIDAKTHPYISTGLKQSFCDFENVALGVRDASYSAFSIQKVLERLLLKGNIVVKKAYCDWDRYKEFKGDHA